MDQESILSKVVVTLLMFLIYLDGVKLTPTYEHKDRISGQVLLCHRCPPGYHMLSHCTATHQTKCGRCPPNHFTEVWNYLPKCLYCNVFCTENQIVKKECSANFNRVCECKEGYYWHSDFCLKHAECPRGYGVKRKGTAHRNTKCEMCARGFYSTSTSSQDTCLKHTNCTAHGLQLILRGTTRRDHFCVSSEDLKSRGGLALLKEILPEFLASTKRPKKVTRIFQRFSRAARFNHGFEEVQNLTWKWVQDAEEDKIRRLPSILREFDLHHIANKLEKLIKRLL